MTLLAKSTIRSEDARNPVRHLGSKQSFLPSIAVQIATSEFATTSEFANSVVLWRHPGLTVPASHAGISGMASKSRASKCVAVHRNVMGSIVT
jgi:hypothetical protein